MKEERFIMPTAVESANLILKLYELRREPVMREARNFFFSFNPATVEEYFAGMMGPNGAHMRMVSSYWEMAASFVVNGAIDATMFEDSAGEHIIVFGKLEGILPQLRQAMGSPTMFKNLEQVCTSAPGGLEKVRARMEHLRNMMAQRTAAAA
jgi:hypothetical protein